MLGICCLFSIIIAFYHGMCFRDVFLSLDNPFLLNYSVKHSICTLHSACKKYENSYNMEHIYTSSLFNCENPWSCNTWLIFVQMFWHWLSFEKRTKTCTLFWVDFFIEFRCCIQVCVGYWKAKHFVCELRWFLIDVWWMFTPWINYCAYWKWNHIDGRIINMNSHNILHAWL